MRSRLQLAAAVAGMAATAMILGACASLPSRGQVPLTGHFGPRLAQQGVVFVPDPPGAGWGPRDIVTGFVIASASADDNFAVAREYLTSQYNGIWKPGWAATVVDPAPNVTLISMSSHVTGGHGPLAQAELTSLHQAILAAPESYEAGHLLVSTGPSVFKFVLTQQNGQWRIDGIYINGAPAPPTQLLLTSPDFVRDYQARNLYFFPAKSSASTLIPDTVFIPQQAGPGAGAQGLADALKTSRRAGWLNEATSTAFPAGTTIDVQVSGIKAVVDLGGTAKKASPAQLRRMAAQLVWTLTSTSYSAPATIRSVELLVNHKAWSPGGIQQPLLPRDFASWVPRRPDARLYFQVARAAAEPQVQAWPAGTAPVPVTLPRIPGHGSFTAIAVSPGTPSQAYFAGCRGKDVYLGPLQRGTPVVRQTLAVNCTSLSWQLGQDGQPNLWVPDGHEILMLAAGGPSGEAGQTVVVTPALPAGDTVTSLQVAPDGVRVAMIVHTGAGSEIMLAAISQTQSNMYLGQNGELVTVGSDILAPLALSWLDPDDLLVLDGSAGAGDRLYQVPLDGGVPAQVITPANTTSVAASDSAVVVGTEQAGRSPAEIQEQIWISPGLNGPWRRLTERGFSPVFPG